MSQPPPQQQHYSGGPMPPLNQQQQRPPTSTGSAPPTAHQPNSSGGSMPPSDYQQQRPPLSGGPMPPSRPAPQQFRPGGTPPFPNHQGFPPRPAGPPLSNQSGLPPRPVGPPQSNQPGFPPRPPGPPLSNQPGFSPRPAGLPLSNQPGGPPTPRSGGAAPPGQFSNVHPPRPMGHPPFSQNSGLPPSQGSGPFSGSHPSNSQHQPGPPSLPPPSEAPSQTTHAANVKRRLYPTQHSEDQLPPSSSDYNQATNSYAGGPTPSMFVPGEMSMNQQQLPGGTTQDQSAASLINPMANMTFQTAGVPPPLEMIPLLQFQPRMAELNEPAPKINFPLGVALNPNSPYLACNPALFRSTVQAVPSTPALAKKSNLPLGVVMTPFKPTEGDEHVPLIQDTITRCRYCRAYINPFVTLVQTKWKCNLCPGTNDVPQSYDYDLVSHQAVDRFQRPELNCSIVDYSAPVEYTVRAPHPPIYMFIIDVSYASVQNGMVSAAAKSIMDSLDRIPNPDQRNKVAFMTVDSALHFYKLSPKSGEPQMLVVGDLDEVVIPSPEDLVVNLVEARSAIDSLLSRLGSLFKSTQNVGSALGPALNAAHKMLLPAGGKIVVFQTILPTLQSGDMVMREDPKLLGTPKESSLLTPSSNFYKNLALDCVRGYICLDMFLFGSQYMDVATLAAATKYSGGHLYYYPGFHSNRSEDVLKLNHEVSEFLAHDIGLEAVLRLRCSTGVRADAYYGNYFLRSTQLLALSNVTPNHCYTVELALDEEVKSSTVAIQSALLYTAISGERRIRVMTMVLPTTSSMTELYQSIDQTALVTFLTKKAVDRALTSKLEDARDALINKCATILNTIKTEFTSSQTGATAQLPVTPNLRHYPIMTLAALKNIGLRGGSTTPSDLRSFAINHLNLSPPELLIPFLAPRMYSLHNLPQAVGSINDQNRVELPTPLNLRSDILEPHGVYLLDSVHRAMLYVGSKVDPRLMNDLFSVASYGALFGGKMSLPLLDTPISRQVQAILQQHRKDARDVYYQEIYVVKEDGDPSLKLLFLTHMVEDRTNSVPSYQQFVHQLLEKVNSGNL